MSELIEFAPRWHYAAVLVFCVLVTLPLEFVLGARVYRDPKRLGFALLGAVPFVVWDVVATDRGHWWFSEKHLLGPTVVNLPVEEVLFFVVIPICGILTYEAVGRITTLRRRSGEREDVEAFEEVG